MVKSLLTAAISLTTLFRVATAETVEVWYNVTYTTANPDGLYDRQVIGVNGTWPPPIVNVNMGDVLLIHATNGLGDVATTLHHHGMIFGNASYYDGAYGVTQCGIPPGDDFDYIVDTTTQVGTYWWHSHYNGQMVDGLKAPLLIHNPDEPYGDVYDEEFTIFISDWYHEQHSQLLDKFFNIANPTGAEPIPDSSILYLSQNGTYLPGFSENATLPFVPGKTYRLRIINGSAFSMFWFWIDGHQMEIIEVDGTDTERYPVDWLGISVAQRYSILVTAQNDTSQNYYLHFNMNGDMFDYIPDDLVINRTANIVYDTSSPYAEPTMPQVGDFDDFPIVPYTVQAELPDPITSENNVTLNVFFDTMTNGINRAMFNNITYQTPVVPSLFTALTMEDNSTIQSVYGPMTNAFVLDYQQTVELNVWNWDSGLHPFHLHGHKFQVVYRSFDVTSDDPSLNPPVTTDQTNPLRRDTIMIPGGGRVILRFTADNPGAWIFHCHIDWHLSAGLAAIMISSPLEAQEFYSVPDELASQCLAQNIPVAGNAAGKFSTTDLKGAPYGPFEQVPGWHTRSILAFTGCVVTAFLGMGTVVWYALGGQMDEDEMAEEVDEALKKKAVKRERTKNMVKSLGGLRMRKA